jgi:hypothetical protein
MAARLQAARCLCPTIRHGVTSIHVQIEDRHFQLKALSLGSLAGKFGHGADWFDVRP